MIMDNEAKYRHLNLNNRWDLFELEGLENLEGFLQLARVAGNPEIISLPLVTAAEVEGPAGIGVDQAGHIYLADTANHLIWHIDACDGRRTPLPCIQGPGQDPGQLNEPRGLLVGSRNLLYVADSGNHRVQVFDLGRLQLQGIWGPEEPYQPPAPSAGVGGFDRPWDLAADSQDHIYVTDFGNRRVQKFRADGQVIPEFWGTMEAEANKPAEPSTIAITLIKGEERLLVVDRAGPRLLVFHLDGTFDEKATKRWEKVPNFVAMPGNVVAHQGRLYVGDEASGQLMIFDEMGTFVGVARDVHQPIAGLAFDCQGRLLLHAGDGAGVVRFWLASAHVACGTFLAGPFEVAGEPTTWHRLKAKLTPLEDGCHVQFFSLTSDTLDGSAGQKPEHPQTCTSTQPGQWLPAPADADDFLILNPPGRYLWLAGLLQGDGNCSPRLEQVRVTYDHETWTQHLPAVYMRDPDHRPHLFRALSLFESFLDDASGSIDNLPHLFDPWAAPNENAPESWLDWLAGWLAFDLEETWSESQRRQALAMAFDLYGRRGTVEALRQMIKLYTGVTAHIMEPNRSASLWSLGEISVLGANTMLAPAHAQGAVVGTTATLDQSHLIEDEDYGAPLFEDVAHRFCVQIYAAEMEDEADARRVSQVIEREKPAHTQTHLCLIEARLQVGFQARIGVDTIVGGPAPDVVLDSPGPLGVATMLPAATDRAIGQGAKLGAEKTMLV
jgi:phage tail-like protein